MSDKGLVLVTGINGYIGARTAEAFLEAGYSVRGTVRSLPSAAPVIAALNNNPKFEVVSVPDITAPGAFDAAVKGVSGVAHLAAPVSLAFTDPEPVLKGAVQGMLTLLDSAVKETSIKSVVLMSSIAAVSGDKPSPAHYTEEDWNNVSEGIVAAQGKDAPGMMIYAASKAAAEKAFWKFRTEKKPSFSMTAVNPVFVAGPPLVQPAKPEDVAATTYGWVLNLLRGDKVAEASQLPFSAFVDVRDVGRLFVFGVEHPEKANGERYIASGYFAPPQAAADVLRKAFPDRKIDEGSPGEGYFPDYSFPEVMNYDGTKAVRATGVQYIPFDKMVVDTAKVLEPLV